ncbi:hypothetical protein, partial [Streptomyces lancefieldiae]
AWSRIFIKVANDNPAGPPPTHTIFTSTLPARNPAFLMIATRLRRREAFAKTASALVGQFAGNACAGKKMYRLATADSATNPQAFTT